jgi:hypothetical protein
MSRAKANTTLKWIESRERQFVVDIIFLIGEDEALACGKGEFRTKYRLFCMCSPAGERAFTPAEPNYGGAGGVNWLTFQLGILGFGVKKTLHFSVSLPFSVQFGQKETKFYHY